MTFQIQKSGDSKSLHLIDGKPFTIVGIEDSNYEDGDKVTPGVKITTKESFTIEGNKVSKFHTTRDVVVKRLRESDVTEALSSAGSIGPLICSQAKGKKYFVLSDA